MTIVSWYYRISIDINDGINSMVTVPLDFVDIKTAYIVFDALALSDTVVDARLYSMSTTGYMKLRRKLSDEIFDPEKDTE